ncbi:related to mRNA 3'-end-processing protein RNA14 [Cephalotrichum gorgonifer]|uniref:mRNA 3'-end-processing protein RNA14 n=1 Tax=Cephalotrichum gorgonifer TaxID=2041049 RepID=A0AAE8N5L7_9PEZI|nr:related to mRNA 3'-end-processing protein RNA14 [Cephalotrichum gorgonifer]
MASDNLNNEGPTWGEDLDGDANDDYQPDIELSDEQTQDPSSHGAVPSADFGDIGEDLGDDGAEYDPEAISAPQPVPAASQSKPTPPRTTGGFIVSDDSDSGDEEEEEEEGEGPPAVSGADAESSIAPVASDVASSARDQVVPPEPHSLSAQVANGSPASQVAGVATQGAQVTPHAVDQAPDRVAVLESRVKEDPRGDMDAWLALIEEYRRRDNMEEVRSVYNRFLEVFPQSAEAWASWVELELNLNNFVEAEQLFGRCLMLAPNVRLWTVYLNYIRRRNDLNNDPEGRARKVVTQAYEFVIDTIGIDKDSAKIWQDYIQFIRSGPGQIGGSNWQDQQKMDQLRKAYQRAICVPISAINQLWKEYDQFEMGLNKMTGRKFIQERSPSYMSAKSANMALANITRNLNRTTYPRLPPAPGFEGDAEFNEQVEIWKKWIAWEKEDPLVLLSDEPAVYKQRILHCYKQSLMALRFVPEMWVDAAEWCFENQIMQNGQDTGLDLLTQGVAANPESVLLALKHADRIESTHAGGESDEARREFASAVREPYNRVLDTLYDMCKDLKEKEQADLAQVETTFSKTANNDSYDDYDDAADSKDNTEKENRIKAIQQGYAARADLLSRTISHVWIALARAMRRIQGKGGVGVGGLRQVFVEARKRGKLTSDVYVAVALMESVVYRDPVGAKIFERGMTLFPEDEVYLLEYLKYLHSKDDTTNARVVFETCVNRLVQKPETVSKAKPLYSYFHKYESQYGELAQISKLEARMAELFPDDPKLAHFKERYSTPKFDPITARMIISPRAQLRPKMLIPSIERAASVQRSRSPAPPMQQPLQPNFSPRPQFARATASPKRAFQDDHDEPSRPRKLARGESPLKGAAGRRLDQQRRNQASALHREITFFLSILPPASSYDSVRFNAGGMAQLLAGTAVPDYSSWKATQDQSLRQGSSRPAYPAQQRPQSPYGSARPQYQQAPGSSRGYEQYRQEGAPPQYGGAPQTGYAPPQQQYGGYRY